MSVSERDRQRAFTKIAETLGPDVADVLMEPLPLRPTNELVTQGEMLALSARLQGEMAELRAELRDEMAVLGDGLRREMSELRGDMNHLDARITGQLVQLRSELRGEMAELRAELRTEMARLYRWGAAVIAANAAAVIAVLLA